MNSWKVILATVVIFGCGVLTGALVSGNQHTKSNKEERIVKSPAPPWQLQRIDFLKRIEKHLDLTAEQRARIEKIMRESQDRTKPLWDQIAPQMREELKSVRQAIRSELTPEQQKKFESLLKPHSSRKGDEGEDKRRRSTLPKPEAADLLQAAPQPTNQ